MSDHEGDGGWPPVFDHWTKEAIEEFKKRRDQFTKQLLGTRENTEGEAQ